MRAIADTDALVAAEVITVGQAREIEIRSRQAMVVLGVNSVLCFGILSATGGLVFWLRDPVAVAVVGSIALLSGIAILRFGSATFGIFGNSATLIGAGMLSGGATLELLIRSPDIAGQTLAVAGAMILLIAGLVLWKNLLAARFAIGSICLIGLAMHLGGLGYLLAREDVSGPVISLFYLYAATLVASTGWFLDVRLVSALAIVPFAQLLDTGALYFHALYAFYSPEPTLSILQMSALVVVCLLAANSLGERTARHARVLAVLAFVVANLCALVGSLWGDVVGETIWGPGFRGDFATWEQYQDAMDTFTASAVVIPDTAFVILWAVALVATALWAAHRNNRGVFNTALVFGCIHAYTQLFESFGHEPFAYVIGGLAAIPVAWGMWRFDRFLKERSQATPTPDV